MEQIVNLLLHLEIWTIIKIFVLIGLAVYIAFAFIAVRQVTLMTNVISGILTWFLRLVAWLFFLFSIAVFVFALKFL